jgi:hypothetical protein
MESDGLHVYQIKGNAMTSLSVKGSTVSTPGTAVFNGKASIQDITTSTVLSVGGNATLQVTMTDMGEPGKSDRIAITVWDNSGGLWFANNWDGTKTVEQKLDGGNLKVSSTTSFATGSGLAIVGLTTSKNPSVSGEAITLTATVGSSSTTKPTGTVTFYDYSANPIKSIGSVQLNSGVASLSISSLTIGSHNIVAYYSGDSKYGSGAADLTQVVRQPSITMMQSVEMDNVVQEAATDAKFGMKVFPNPSRSQFNVHVESSDRNAKINLRVIDLSGRTVRIIPNLTAGQTVQLGSEYRPGIYFVEMIQGKSRTQTNLVKAID